MTLTLRVAESVKSADRASSAVKSRWAQVLPAEVSPTEPLGQIRRPLPVPPAAISTSQTLLGVTTLSNEEDW